MKVSRSLTAASLVGCPKPKFSLDHLETVIESGKDLLQQQIKEWQRDPTDLLEEIDKWEHSP